MRLSMAVAASNRSKGSRWPQFIIEAYCRSKISDFTALLLEKRRKLLDKRLHLRPIAEADLLADFKQADRADENMLRLLHHCDRSR